MKALKNICANHDINKFASLFWEGFYPYKCMDDWEKFSKTSFPEKDNFYSHLNMEDITDADYTYAKTVSRFSNENCW